MKRILFIFLATLISSSVFLACKDSFLESRPQDGTFTDLSLFKNKADFDSYMFGAYTELQEVSANNALRLPSFISQDVVGVDEQVRVIASYMVPGNGDFSNYWTRYYKAIARTNEILERLPKAPSVIKAAEKTILEGEAKFIRGYAYFCLARAFGNIPMPLETYSEAQNSMECTPEAQVWDQVIKDLTDAAAKLPRKGGWDAGHLGRATKGSALGFLANAHMYKKDWANAKKAAVELDALGTYKLLPDVRQVFSQINENTDESLFEIQYRDVPNGNYVWSGQPNNGNLLNEFTAPRNLGDAYAPFGGWG